MNTDNMALSGETIDYGPCAFIDAYDPAAVFSSIDHQGRYAFGQQPAIAAWNLARLAEALLPILHPKPETALARANAALESFSARFHRHWLAAMRAKLGLFSAEPEDASLAEELLRWMHQARADYTHTFRNLRPHATPEPTSPAEAAFTAWHRRWTERLARQPQPGTEVVRLMNAHNPAVIPRNHEVEAALTAATTGNDLAPLERLHAALATPYDEAGPTCRAAESTASRHPDLPHLLRHVSGEWRKVRSPRVRSDRHSEFVIRHFPDAFGKALRRLRAKP